MTESVRRLCEQGEDYEDSYSGEIHMKGHEERRRELNDFGFEFQM
jgi:hypothetical protein